jgi:hypothetical protein
MTLATIRIGKLSVSRLILGGNPFSGFSHQGPERDREMRSFYTPARICQVLSQAEALGINTFIGRADDHIVGVLRQHQDAGGSIQWIAQTCPEHGTPLQAAKRAIAAGPAAAYIHGGVMDNLLAAGRLSDALPAIQAIRDAGLPVGVAGHRPEVFRWAEDHCHLDFAMCSYYNPIPRHDGPEHRSGCNEAYLPEDRDSMVAQISRLRAPAIHYKVMAAGRNDPRDAFAFVGRHLRPNDAVCVGVFTRDVPDMLARNVALLNQALANTHAC